MSLRESLARKKEWPSKEGIKAPSGFEPLHKGFADLSLTTWVRRRVLQRYQKAVIMSSRMEHKLLREAHALFIAPPVYDFALFDLFLRPYGLLRSAALFEQSGYEISFIDALDPYDRETAALYGRYPKRKGAGRGKFFRRPAKLPEGVLGIKRQFSRYGIDRSVLEAKLKALNGRRGPDIICIGTGMTYWYPGVLEVIHLSRQIWPDTPIVAGGVYASLLPDHLESLGGNLKAIAGALDRGGAGRKVLDTFLMEELLVPLSGDLPRYPPMMPLKSGWDPWAEWYPGIMVPESRHGKMDLHPALVRDGGAVIRLNRGCPYRCDYCASRLLEPACIAGDIDSLYEYIKALSKEGVKSFAFYDDALLLNKEEQLLPLLEKLIQNLPGLSFFTPNAMHLRMMDRETAELMRRSGFRDLRFGYESNSEEFHLLHDRKYRPGEATAAFDALKQAGFRQNEVLLYVLGGLPGQKKKELLTSINSARESGFQVQVAEYSPVPGTPMWEESVRLARFPIAEEPLYQNNSFKPLSWEGLTEEDLEDAKRFALF